MPERFLDNVVWHSLAGTHAPFATGTASAKRFARGFPPMAGFQDPARPDFAALAPYCEPGDRLYCAGWSGPVAPGWRIELDSSMHQFVWEGPMPPEVDDVARLDAGHAEQMVALVALTKPGPFGPRSTELGEYYGLFEGDRLVAMAGERLAAGPWREVSAVCTHPDFQGRGLARRLMDKVIRLQMGRGQRPFLHVMDANTRARELYGRMGFRRRRELALRVVAPAA